VDESAAAREAGLTARVAVIALTAILYTIGKWITAGIQTPWGVGQLLIGIFLPAFMAVTADTLSVAIGAGLGTFVGDIFVRTNPLLSLLAGVPANFVAFLLFGWFVKKYKSWPAFVAGTVAFVTLGNLIAAINVYLFLPVALGASVPSSAILGLTVFWNTTSIPAILIAVPILVRAVRPLTGRSRILTYYPAWSSSIGGKQTIYAVAFALLYAAFGGLIFLISPASVATAPGLGYFAVAAVVVLVFGPLSSMIAGSRAGSKNAPG
jgi:hypothetical protein